MKLDDIKQFMDWCREGDSTLDKRYEIFFKRKQNVEDEIKQLQDTLDFINCKCTYYEQAIKDGTEKNIKSNVDMFMPQYVKNQIVNR